MSLDAQHPSLFQLGYTPHSYDSPRLGYKGTSLQALQEAFPTELSLLKYLFHVRFGDKPVCDRCRRNEAWYCAKGKRYFMHPCGRVRSPMADTLFHGTKLPLRIWVYAMLHFANSPQGVNSRFLTRHLGVGRAAASRLTKRIRLHLAGIDKQKILGEVNEPVIVTLHTIYRVYANPPNLKRTVPILIFTDGKSVETTVLQFCRSRTLLEVIKKKISPYSTLITTCYRTHRVLTSYREEQSVARYCPHYFKDNPDFSNRSYGFLKLVQRSLNDEYRGVHRKNLWMYLKEFEFRFNRREESQNTFWDMLREFPALNESRIEALRTWNCSIETP